MNETTDTVLSISQPAIAVIFFNPVEDSTTNDSSLGIFPRSQLTENIMKV